MTKNEVLEWLDIPKEEWENYKVITYCERRTSYPKYTDVYIVEKI